MICMWYQERESLISARDSSSDFKGTPSHKRGTVGNARFKNFHARKPLPVVSSGDVC